MSAEIQCDRRRLLGTAALLFAAGPLGMLGAAHAQSGTTPPAPQPASEGQQRRPASVHFPIAGELSSLGGATGWLNSSPLEPSDLRGKVALINFWTYTCINWLRQLPYVRAWAEKYTEHGLVVIGVHSPEFAFEKEVENVRRAVADLRVEYPVAIDSDHVIWRAFKNAYWPALYFVDAQGRMRHHHFGEGAYEQSERMMQHLLGEAGSGGIGPALMTVEARGLEAAADWGSLRSPENYVGFARTAHFASPGGTARNTRRLYAAPARLPRNHWALAGEWTVEQEAVVLHEAHGRIAYGFHARDLHLVMGPAARGTAVRFRVFLDGKPPGAAHGLDIDDHGHGTVAEPRLYQLIRQPQPIMDRQFEIAFLDAGVEAFAFTFGWPRRRRCTSRRSHRLIVSPPCGWGVRFLATDVSGEAPKRCEKRSDNMCEAPPYDRRRFLGTAALTMAAAPFSLIGAAHAQSRPTPPAALPPPPPGTHTSFGALKQIEAGVLNVGYAEAGPADGPVVLLLHGWPYDIHTYVDVAPVLAAAGYRVLVPYLRGYGTTRFLSPATPRNGQQAVLAVDTIALMDELKIERAIVAGCDWGARTANILAALWPERCKALVAVSGYLIGSREINQKPLPPPAELQWWYQFYFATERGQAGYAQYRRDFAQLIWQLASPKWAFDAATFERSAAAFDNPDHVRIVMHNYRWRLGLAEGEPQYDALEQRLAQGPFIAVPTITLEGDANGAPHPDASAYAKKFSGPYAHRVITGGIGHNLPQEAPEAFAQAVLDVDRY